MSTTPLDIEELTNICNKEDIASLDTFIKNGFPLYLHLNDVFEIIMRKELTAVFHYVVAYIKSHPLNQILKGGLYGDYYYHINSYELLLLLKTHPTQDQLYDFISNVTGPSHEWFALTGLRIKSMLVFKIAALDLPEEIINVFKNIMIVDHLDRHGGHGPSIYHYNYDYESTTDIRHYNSFETIYTLADSYDEELWNLWDDIGDDKKREQLLDMVVKFESKKEFLDNTIVGTIVKAKRKDLYFRVAPRLDRTINMILQDYSWSCLHGDFDFSFRILVGIESDQVIASSANDIIKKCTEKGFFTTKNKQWFRTAYSSSVKSKNADLIKLNEAILTVCFGDARYVNLKHYLKRRIAKQDNIVPFLDEMFGDKRTEAMRDYLGKNLNRLTDARSVSRAARIGNITKLVEFADKKEVVMDIYSLGHSRLIGAYHLIELGYKDMLMRTVKFLMFGEGVDVLTSDSATHENPTYRNIIAHFDKLNIELRRTFYDTNLFYKDLMGVIFLYLRY